MLKSIAALTCLLLSLGTANAQVAYKLILGDADSFWDPRPLSVNKNGVSLGNGISTTDPNQATVPLAWPSPTEDPYLLSGTRKYPNASALAINDSNVVVGSAYNPDFSIAVACVWKASRTCKPIAGLPGSTFSAVFAINSSGAMTGQSADHAAVWSAKGVPTQLGIYPGDVKSTGYAISSTGTVVGDSRDATLRTRAIMWRDSTPSALPELEGAIISGAQGVNNADIAVGYVGTGSAIYAIAWAPGKMVVLPGLNAFAQAINDQSVIVGAGPLGGACRWTGPNWQTLEDLNDLHDDAYPGVVLRDALAISSNGIIVGTATFQGIQRRYTLVPRQ